MGVACMCGMAWRENSMVHDMVHGTDGATIASVMF